ncbi:MAG TPA: GntR family transcriptional regulator [Clostridiales bacterium]|nr:GntR family transcriptional regulator [Clostridiales bacterium]
MTMIRIDSNSSNPIYEQIYSEFVRLIVSRVLKPNEKIPSVRELASTLRINPNTIVKGYKLLEMDNYIRSEQGKGYFVNKRDESLSTYMKRIELNLKESIKSMRLIKMTDNEIIDFIKNLLKGDEGYDKS